MLRSATVLLQKSPILVHILSSGSAVPEEPLSTPTNRQEVPQLARQDVRRGSTLFSDITSFQGQLVDI